MIKSSVTTRSELGWYGRTKTGGTGKIFIAGILTEIEYARTVNTSTHTNDKTLQISYLIYRYNYSD